VEARNSEIYTGSAAARQALCLQALAQGIAENFAQGFGGRLHKFATSKKTDMGRLQV